MWHKWLKTLRVSTDDLLEGNRFGCCFDSALNDYLQMTQQFPFAMVHTCPQGDYREAETPHTPAHSRSPSVCPLREDPHEVDEEAPILQVSLDVVEWLAAIVLDPVPEPVGERFLLHFHPLLALSGGGRLLPLPTLNRVKHVGPACTHTHTQQETVVGSETYSRECKVHT